MTGLSGRRAWPAELSAAASALLEASDFAAQSRRPSWEFAVEFGELRRLHVTPTDLQLLVSGGLLEYSHDLNHRRKTTRPKSASQIDFATRVYFILTAPGRTAVQALLAPPGLLNEPANGAQGLAPNAVGILDTPGEKPLWDEDLGCLTFGGVLVKHFKTPAPNQRLILTSFQLEGWPRRIDDPLPPKPDLEPKQRLRQTINALNRHQINHLLRFAGDGRGQGVICLPTLPIPPTRRP